MATLYREFTTQDQIDRQYNPSRPVPDPAAAVQHFLGQAAHARATLPCTLDLSYGPTLAETLDIFPASAPGAPVLVFIHGGYWRAFSSKDFSGIALGLQARGITSVVVNYALCPWVSIDEIVRQVRASVAWVYRNIADHGGDPSRIALAGHSAGGHLGAMALQTDWAQDYGLPQDLVRCALLVSGLYDLAPLRYSYLQPVIQLDADIVARNSPAFAARPRACDLWLTWGGAESSEFARQSQVYHEAWQAQGNRSRLEAVPDTNHFTVLHGFEDAGSPFCAWLAERLGV